MTDGTVELIAWEVMQGGEMEGWDLVAPWSSRGLTGGEEQRAQGLPAGHMTKAHQVVMAAALLVGRRCRGTYGEQDRSMRVLEGSSAGRPIINITVYVNLAAFTMFCSR